MTTVLVNKIYGKIIDLLEDDDNVRSVWGMVWDRKINNVIMLYLV